jgi:putative glutamine amidotransferase
MTFYRRALEAAGARVIELSPEAEAEAALARADGILLAGGGDVDPSRYGEAPHPTLTRVEPARDEFELCLASLARQRGVPLLGICRGAQVIGVAGGGRLVQDIPSQIAGACQHSAHQGEPPALHRVRIAASSKLRAVLIPAERVSAVGAEEMCVNSYHHQANKAVGDGIRAVAWSDDGVIEAVEDDGAGFLLGVQWHPERASDDPAQARLFVAFVAAAAQYGKDGRSRRRE